jgi:hypothetical protein
MKNELEWGEGIERSRRARSLGCENADCGGKGIAIRSNEELLAFAVGVRKNSETRAGREYKYIGQCPKCAGRYWYHISVDMATRLKRYHEKHS